MDLRCAGNHLRCAAAIALAGIVLIAAPVLAQEPLDASEERWETLATPLDCQTAELSCTGDAQIDVYINGAFVGACGGAPVEFITRAPLSSTVVLYNTTTDVITAPVLSSLCTLVYAAALPAFPTPTPWIMTPPPQTYVTPESGESGIMGILPGGGIPLPNFYTDVDEWLGYGEDTIGLVNSGNLLYVIGAISVAGLVLSWAIQTIKNPDR